MADYRALARDAAAQYRLPELGMTVDQFLAQLNQESGFHPGVTSSAGAKWIGQFIPSTARAYGVHDDASSILGAAHYMADNLRRYGTVQRALSAYNSGRPDAYKNPGFAGGQTFNYVRSILGANPAAAVAATNIPNGAAAAPPTPTPTPAPPVQRQGITPDVAAILNKNNALIGLPAMKFPTTAPQAPAAPISPPAAGATPTRPATKGDPSRWVRMSSAADRSGVHTSPTVLQFVGSIGQIYGHPLTIGTGTNHNQYVANSNRESQHWTGHAADIPSSGKALTRLGQDALIAAGMNPAEARKATGGVYNIGRYQILFNTKVGGNHFNHLHVGVR